MITTMANELVKPVHPERMPVILHPDDHEQWLHGSADETHQLLRPYPSDDLRVIKSGVEERHD